MIIKCLSIRQPWASFIINGVLNKQGKKEFKDIENRSRRMTYRGKLGIHTGKNFDGGFKKDPSCFVEYLNETLNLQLTVQEVHDMQRGGIIGQVDMAGCVNEHGSKWFFGKYGYVLENPVSQSFLPCSGKMGLFEPQINADNTD